jgi:proton-translocating NADH-quinone oxidoreductase chain M
VGLISISMLIPFLGALTVLLAEWDERRLRQVALLATGITAIIHLFMFAQVGFRSGYQFVESYRWIETLGMSYKVGVDGLSMPMLFLTSLLTFLVVVFSWEQQERLRQYLSLFLFLEVSLIGVFTALDLFLFYVFWEFVLVPMYFIIGIWGGPRKEYAAIKFFIYTFAGSVLMLVGFMAVYFASGTGSFDLESLIGARSAFGLGFQALAFAALFVGFAVKMPVVPLHTWLPDAHVEAPTAGSVMLAAVLLKMGSYGLVRVALPLLPQGAERFVPVMLGIGILSILYGAFVCLAQRDLKRLVAYSSISHMGVVLLGIATLTQLGTVGAVYMMFAHGLISAILFMACGSIQHNLGTRIIERLGGLSLKMPKLGVIITAGFLAGLGLPGMVQFVAEVPVFLAAYQTFGLLLALPILTVVLTAGYALWAVARAMQGPLSPLSTQAHDAPGFQFWPMLLLVALTVLFGSAPGLILGMINNTVEAILALL